jgi:hypothetical protein
MFRPGRFALNIIMFEQNFLMGTDTVACCSAKRFIVNKVTAMFMIVI